MHSYKIYKKNVRFSFFRKKEEYHLDGEITFLENRILVNDRVTSIDCIDKISFTYFDDYNGKVISSADGKSSKGTNNIVTLTEKDGSETVYYFQMDYRYQLRDERKQLVEYHMAGKLDFDNLVTILGLESYNAIQIFKKSLPEGGNIKSY